MNFRGQLTVKNLNHCVCMYVCVCVCVSVKQINSIFDVSFYCFYFILF